MQYFRENFVNIVIFLLMIVMAYFSSIVVLNNPGMSVSRWIFGLGPLVAVGITIVTIKMCTNAGYSVSDIFSFSPAHINRWAFLAITALAVVMGIFLSLNPYDFIFPVFTVTIIFLFVLSVYLIIAHKMVDAIGLLLISLPLITYAENQIVSKTGFGLDWITIKIAIIMLFASIWVFVNIFVDKKPLVKGKFNALILMFCATTFFSAVFSTDITYSLKRWLFEIVYPIVVYFIIINSIKYEIDIRRFMAYLVAGVFLNLTLVLYYFAKHGSSEIVMNRHALYLYFADGVLVANVLIMVIPIVIAFVATTNTKSLKLLFYTMTAAGTAGLAMSFARMAQLSMAIGLLALGLNKKTRKYSIVIIAAGVLIFTFYSGELDPYLSKYKHLTSFENIVYASSMERRYVSWKAAIDMFKDHPVLGIGIGRYSQEYANYGILYYYSWADDYVPMISAHNMYLNYLAETGLAGILLLLAIFFTVVVKGVGLIKKAADNYVFKYSLLISVFIFLSNNFVDGITFAYVKEIDKGLIFWSITAIIMSYGIIKKNHGSHLLDRG